MSPPSSPPPPDTERLRELQEARLQSRLQILRARGIDPWAPIRPINPARQQWLVAGTWASSSSQFACRAHLNWQLRRMQRRGQDHAYRGSVNESVNDQDLAKVEQALEDLEGVEEVGGEVQDESEGEKAASDEGSRGGA